MTDEEIDAAAKALYTQKPYHCHPTWEQLGGVTKSVWRERVRAEAEVDLFADPEVDLFA